MTGVLIVAHGSRAKQTEASLDQMIDRVRAKQPLVKLAVAFMEFSDRTIDKAVAELASAGVTKVTVLPYFLFYGIHLQEDIPEMIEQTARRYPDIQFQLTEPLGSDPRLADIILDRIGACPA